LSKAIIALAPSAQTSVPEKVWVIFKKIRSKNFRQKYEKIRFDGIGVGIISRKINAIEIFVMPKLQGLYRGEKQECVTFSEKNYK